MFFYNTKHSQYATFSNTIRDWRYFNARLCEQLSRGMTVSAGIRPNQQTGAMPHGHRVTNVLP